MLSSEPCSTSRCFIAGSDPRYRIQSISACFIALSTLLIASGVCGWQWTKQWLSNSPLWSHAKTSGASSVGIPQVMQQAFST